MGRRPLANFDISQNAKTFARIWLLVLRISGSTQCRSKAGPEDQWRSRACQPSLAAGHEDRWQSPMCPPGGLEDQWQSPMCPPAGPEDQWRSRACPPSLAAGHTDPWQSPWQSPDPFAAMVKDANVHNKECLKLKTSKPEDYSMPKSNSRI